MWREETVQRALGATWGKVGATGLRTSHSSCHYPHPTMPSIGSLCTFHTPDAVQPWHRIGSATAKTPRAHQKIPARGQQLGRPVPQGPKVGEHPRERRPRPCSLRWRAGAEARCLEVSTLKTAHLSRWEQHLLPTGLGHTRRGGVPYNRDGKYHSSRAAPLINAWQLPP